MVARQGVPPLSGSINSCQCVTPYAKALAVGEALKAEFTTRSHRLAPQAVERLVGDWERLVTFSQFPANTSRTCGPATWENRPSRPYGYAPQRPNALRKSRTRLR
jgi:hypothetical protein